MTVEIAFIFLLLITVIGVFIWDKFRMDLVALTVLTVLAISGIITPKEAVSGFGSSIVIMIAGLFVVGEALMLTGVAAATGNWLLKIGGSNETRLLLFLLPLVAFLSAFMSSTGAVALLIPVVMSIARKSDMRQERLLMPLAFSALMGGMLTLIGTPPNIVASGQMQTAGLGSFSFFAFTPIGLSVFAVGMLYLMTMGRFLLPLRVEDRPNLENTTLNYFTKRYQVTDQLHRLSVPDDSLAIGQTISELRPRRDFEITPFARGRRGKSLSFLLPVLLETQISAGDILWVYGSQEQVERFCAHVGLRQTAVSDQAINHLQKNFGFAEALIPPDSKYLNQTIEQTDFRSTYGLNMIALRRDGETITTVFSETELKAGDSLLLAGSWANVRILDNPKNLLIIGKPTELEDIPIRAGKAFVALGIMFAMLVTMTAGWLPNLTTVLIAALMMVLSKCITLSEAYRSLNTVGLVLIAGMLPMALAMEKSGALAYLVNYLVGFFKTLGPLWLCGGLFLMTSLLSQFISNTATTVLLAPIALSTAQLLGYQPQAFVMTVAIAASTAFATPIASPVNTLVLNPGRYRFMDFVKVGIPLQLLSLIVTLLLVPLLFPFGE